MAPPSVAGYADQLSVSDTDYSEKLTMVRAFLAYGKKAGWSQTNLGTHLKTKKSKTGTKPVARQAQREVISLSRERYGEMENELANLKKRSGELIKEIQSYNKRQKGLFGYSIIQCFFILFTFN